MIAVLVTLFISVRTAQKVAYLDLFFTSVSPEYREVKGGDVPDTVGASVAGDSNDNSEKMCANIDIDLTSDPFVGDPQAPVTIVEYSDFECPFCARYFSSTYLQIKAKYIDSGMARLFFKDFPLDNIHPLARPAAIAANCVYKNKGDAAFFEMHDRIFETQAQMSAASIERLALDSGLTLAALDACRADSFYDDEIDADLREGQSLGINGTPSFVINGELVIGARPLSDFERAIDDALAGNGCQG